MYADEHFYTIVGRESRLLEVYCQELMDIVTGRTVYEQYALLLLILDILKLQ
mgnify:FL=1